MASLKLKSSYPYFVIAAGTFILAVGLNMFLVPNKVSVGGVTSVGTVLLYIFKIPLSVTNLIANAVLMLIGYKYLGKTAFIKNIFGILSLSLFLEITAYFPYYTEDFLLASVFGGAIMGIGLGIVIRYGGSTGGSDFASLILNRFFPHISIASLILIIDGIIILFTGAVFRSITITLYSIIALYICSKVTDTILTIGFSAKSVYIITKEQTSVSNLIMNDFHRGVTGIKSLGMYTGNESLMLMCVVSAKQLPHLVKKVRKKDADAFIIIGEAHEVFGKGFRNEIEL